ncbi:MAG: hypothetical protein R3C19_05635 [Planctomycetaceae bacterium]
MDSSRGGPLTNFIMVLPLIVVPLIAILRPAERGSGVTSDDLSAASMGDALDDFGDLDFDSLNSADENGGFLQNSGRRDDFETRGGSAFSDQPTALRQDFGNRQTAATLRVPENSPVDQQQRFTELSRMGASRTMWFNPGSSRSVGFAAFFPAGDGIISYRFESIASSETAAMDDVIRQVREFQGASPAADTVRAQPEQELPWEDSK